MASSLELLLSQNPRRGWILFTIIAITILYTWSSVQQLSDLVEVQQLPEGLQSRSLIDLAESNIASHLHIKPRLAAFRGSLDQTSVSSDTIGRRRGEENAKLQKVAVPTNRKASLQLSEDESKMCAPAHILRNTDYWGDALVWGHSNKAASVEDCCAQCVKYKPTKENDNADCNVWVFCEDKKICGARYGECWLKHLAHPDGVAPREGPDIGYTSGILHPPAVKGAAVATGGDRTYHIVITAQGTAVHWQSRVHYYWYRKIKKQCEAAGKCDMGGFTRILHSGKADDLMDEMPTFVANELPAEHPNHGYVVLNRPYAFLQWIQQATIPEKYVLMSEPDHVWLKPMPNLMKGEAPAAFPFFYIEPSKTEFLPITRTFVGPVNKSEAEKIAPIGNAPTLLSMVDLEKTVPMWFNLSIAIHNDEVAAEKWGWVQEMYAFTLSLYKAGIRHVDLHLKMMSQPPYDSKMEPFYLLHYTYGMDYTLDGKFTPGKYGEWRFDKRSYSGRPPPRHLGEPPKGMQNQLVRHLIHAINEATDAIPGWDEYEKTGVADELWDGVV